MNIFSAIIALLAACLLGAPASAAGMTGTVPGVATILNSGSTNTGGYTVRVYAGGKAEITMTRAGSIRRGAVSRRMASDLFGAIHAAQSSTRQFESACMKSASFGTTMRVKYGTWISNDLSCPVSGAMTALKQKAMAVLTALRVEPAAIGRPVSLPINEPRRQEPPSPSATPRPLL
ncbi:MAG: hypothetical protein M3126_04660 [Candidatus Eremiobacteraeota bacterium]|nr:hypothetical protein [Candidatus Eremiobacteraeota bacterium]